MTTIDLKTQIERSIMSFSQGNLRENGIRLLKSLGYSSDRQVTIEPNTFAGFVEIHPPLASINKKKALVENWLSVDILLQLTGEDLKQMTQGHLIFDKNRIDNQIIESYLFLAIELKPEDYSRTRLAYITREVNRFFAMPVMILFKYGEQLTLSIINRRLHKKDESKDVLEKVTLIKGINIKNPIRAHIEILFDLSLSELEKTGQMHSFVELHRAWQKTLDISELNKRFYREIANWYFYAVEHVEFPKGTTEDRQTRNATNIIRLITRLIFVWFIKEKGIVPDALFNPTQLKEILNFNDPQNSTYYKAILQNLFFATLNTEMGPERRFRGKNKNPNGLDAHHGISTVYRYEDFFKDPSNGLTFFSGIPFLNGGLFECLDKREEKILVDGFSDDPRNQPVVPDSLFFGDELTVDMSEVYGDKHHNREKVRGLIRIFDSYKFTIEENTPLDEEIALDPELLGKVFENLLAAYNPETGTTARKQTGSFYTPREIVNYMVDESLIAFLQNSLQPDTLNNIEKAALETKLRHLLAYNKEAHQFTKTEEDQIISAIDKIKVLDPACGSGAFPMGVLHKLVFILNKLDPGNVKWKKRQVDKAGEIPDTTVRDQVIEDIEKSFSDNELDYGRKLYLIENCIYGVDIQPIAVQIAKLRFFISLVVDQNTIRSKPNLGIRPLPNLESKFVAANTLIGIEKPQQMLLHNPVIDEKEKQLAEVRDSLFTARTPATKRKYRELDKQLREVIAKLLKNDGWSNATATQLANWDPYNQNASAAFFDPEWMFGIGDGFDVLLGNPPYITLRSLDDQMKTYIRQHYKFSVGGDIYVAFIERSINLLVKGGTLSFIVPNKFFGADYGKMIRKYLQHGDVEVSSIWDLKDEKVFESAMISTIVIVIRNQKTGLIPILKQGNDSFEFPDLFDTDGKIQIESNKASKSIIEKIRNQAVLGDLADIRTGIMGFEYWKMEPIVRDAEPESNTVKLFTNGNFTNYVNKWGIQGVDLYKKHYLKPVIKLDPAFINRNTIELFRTTPKIIVRGVSKRLAAILDEDGSGLLVAVHTIIPTKIPLKYALGLLNSELLNWFHLKTFYSVRIPEGSLKYPISFFKQIPIPLVDDKNKTIVEELENLVEIVLYKKHEDTNADISTLEANIDCLVYELYGLTDEEIALVKGNPSDSKRIIPSTVETADEIIDDMTEPIEIIEIPIQSDYDLYKCGLCGKLIIGHDRENHSKVNHHGQVDWIKLKK